MLQAAMFTNAPSRNAEALAFLRGRADAASSSGPWDETPLTRAVVGKQGAFVVPPEPPPQRGVDPRSRRSLAAERTSLILDLGADPNERLTWDGVDWTPLSIAIHRFDFGAARTLLEQGADPALRDWQGRTAADYRTAARAEQQTPNPEQRTPNNEP